MNAIISKNSATPTWRILRGLSIVLLFLLISSSLAEAQSTNTEQEGQPEKITTGQVVAVVFQGNNALSSDELATVTSTKVTGWFTRKLHGIPFLNAGADYQTTSLALLNHDTAALNEYYKDHGYIDARSSVSVHANRDDLHNYYEQIRQERLTQTPGTKSEPLPQVRDTVIFTIKEGTLYTISRISIEGLESLPNEFQPDLTEHVTIKSGQPWSYSAATNEDQRLINILVEDGYPNARSDSIIVQHTYGFHDVNVLLYFHPGHRYRFGGIHIAYDTTATEKSRIHDNVILSQLYIDSGQWYKFSRIQKSEGALARLGTFDLFRVSLDTNYISSLPEASRDSSAIPVLVFLRMKHRADAQFGLGGGQGTQGFIFQLSAGFTDKNITDNADNLSVQGSWQPFPPSLTRYNGNIDYVRPLIPFVELNHIPLIVGLGYNHQVEEDSPKFTFVSYSVHAGSNIVISAKDNRTTISPDGLIAYVNTDTKDLSISATAPAKQVNLIGSLGYQDDRTNDLVNPTSGGLFSTSLEIGFPTDLFYSPSSAYLKAVPQIKEYIDLSDRGTAVIAFHLRAGTTYLLQSFDTSRDPSLDRRFYGGGSTSNRGWAEQSLLVSQNHEKSALEGGYNDLEANIEFRFAPFQYPNEFTSWQSISSPIRLVLFYDLGNVWDNIAWTNPSQALTFKMMAQTIGFGIRYNTFFGALRFDWGFKLYDPSGQFQGYPTAPSITPDMTGGWIFKHKFLSLGNTSNIHFGIGQAF